MCNKTHIPSFGHWDDKQTYEEYCQELDPDLLQPMGKEHYRLLALLSTMYDGVDFFDVGTHTGLSAYALAFNPRNRVFTFDICEKDKHPKIQLKHNIIYINTNLLDPIPFRDWSYTILGAKIVFLDIDPHDGFRERVFYNSLKEYKYQGLLICDDIHHFDSMRENFWNAINPLYRLDITCCGHWSGTGVVAYADKQRQIDDFLIGKGVKAPRWDPAQKPYGGP